jgi:glycosyltransferase involved in cell wall biosynthesis
MNKIAIDATGAKTYGAKYNIKCLVEYFEDNQDGTKLYVYISESFLECFDNENIIIKYYALTNNIFLRIFWTLFILPITTKLLKINIVYSPFDIGPLLKFNQKYILGIKNPNSILPINLKSLKYPNTHQIISKLSSHFSDKIIFPSNFAMDLISKKMNINSDKTFTVHHGFDSKSWIINDQNFETNIKYIFFCSLFYKFKNLELLIELMNILKNKHNSDLKLYLCGKFVNNDYKIYIHNLIIDYNLENTIVFYNSLPKNQIVSLYNNASFNIIPTKFETFGHMYLEAITTKCPVLVYDIPIAREILQNSVEYFNETNLNGLAELIFFNKFKISEEMKAERLTILNKFSIENECINTFKILK